MSVQTTLRWSVLLFASLMQGCSTIPKPDNATLTIGFAEAVFGLGIDPKAQHQNVSRNRVLRWSSEKAVYLSIRGSNIYSPEGQSIFARIRDTFKLAGITLLEHHKEGMGKLNLRISDNKVETVNSFLAPCYASIDAHKNGFILEASIVVVRSKLDDPDSRCIEHESMHALGFGGHPHRITSVLSYTQKSQKLSQYDEKMLSFLYGSNVNPGMDIGNAVSAFYNALPRDAYVSRKHYTPQDISIEIEEHESPLQIKLKQLKNASKRITFKRNIKGNTWVNADYAGSAPGSPFASLSLTQLSQDYHFPKRVKLAKYVESLEGTFGETKVRESGEVQHKWASLRYIIGDSPQHSCVYTIKYKGASIIGAGGHQLVHGFYCQNNDNPMTQEKAEAFLSSIHLRKIDPVDVREKTQKAAHVDDFYALLITGRWPQAIPVSGFALMQNRRPAKNVQIRVGNETCEGSIGNSPLSHNGDWEFFCQSKGKVSGVYFPGNANELVFAGKLQRDGAKVRWRALRIQ